MSHRPFHGSNTTTLRRSLSAIFMLLTITGCGGGSSVTSYHPKASVAKTALITALDAWKSGQEKPGSITTQKPAIEVQDSVWGSGRKLKSFEVGEEQAAKDGPPRFTVELTFADKPETEKADYVVVGKDPLWVMREKDFQKMSGQ